MHALTQPETALAAARFVRFVALLGLWGTFAYLAVLVPRSLARVLERRLAGAARVAVGLVGAATLAMLPVQAAGVGVGWSDALRGDTLRAVLFETSIGTAWQLQTAACVMLLAAACIPRRSTAGALSGTAALALAATTFSGHAVMAAGMGRVLHQANDTLHLLAGGAWLGSLVPLTLILHRLGTSADHRDEAVALRRFSTAGHLAVALVVATGVVNEVLILGKWPFDWHVPYQALLSFKVAVVAVMVGLAVLNRYSFVPMLAANRAVALQRLRTVTLTEICLGAVVVAAVAVFGLLEPMPRPDGTGMAPPGLQRPLFVNG